MTFQLFEEISLYVGISTLILYMLFILYKISDESGAGKFGTAVIFFALGLGIAGFAAKSVIHLLVTV